MMVSITPSLHAAKRLLAPTVIQVVNLSFSYPQTNVFSSLSFNLSAGVTLVQGGDGSGKTTLMRLLAGDLKPQSGHILFNDLTSPNPPKVEGLKLFWMDPRSTEHDPIKARDYLDQQARRWPDFDRQGLPGLIDGLSLFEFLEKPLYMLSTGSKRKVWLAAAFASNADVALLDDPFAALDKPSIRFVTEVLRRLAMQAKRAVVITGYSAPDNLPLAGLIDLGA